MFDLPGKAVGSGVSFVLEDMVLDAEQGKLHPINRILRLYLSINDAIGAYHSVRISEISPVEFLICFIVR